MVHVRSIARILGALADEIDRKVALVDPTPLSGEVVDVAIDEMIAIGERAFETAATLMSSAGDRGALGTSLADAWLEQTPNRAWLRDGYEYAVKLRDKRLSEQCPRSVGDGR